MESESFQSSPSGIVVIASFWIIVGAWILSMTSEIFLGSYNQAIIGLIMVFLSTGLIIVGWGLLTQRRWAYMTALIMSVLILIPFVFLVFSMLMMIPYDLKYGLNFSFVMYTLFELFLFVLFILMAWYLYKKIKLFPKPMKSISIS
jgi:hypothetical protein